VCSTWLVISWLIAVTLLPAPKDLLLSDIIFFYGIAPALSIPLPIMIFYDVPKRLPQFYQVFLVASVWCWSAYTIAFARLCNYYGGGQAVFDCQGRDMMNLF
jgi:osomolarity two-component system, sensor histidine kinase SLN1